MRIRRFPHSLTMDNISVFGGVAYGEALNQVTRLLNFKKEIYAIALASAKRQKDKEAEFAANDKIELLNDLVQELDKIR